MTASRIIEALVSRMMAPGSAPQRPKNDADAATALCDRGDVPTAEGAPWPQGDVSDELLNVLLSAARVAPSADNSQIWRFVSVRDRDRKTHLAAATGESLASTFAHAPVIVVALAAPFIIKRARREQPFAMVDVPIAMVHLLLQAEELRLSYAWTLDCDEERVKELLDIPAELRVVGMIAVGPSPHGEERPRAPDDD